MDFRIIPYGGSPKHRSGFAAVNEQWISALFELEPIDKELLSKPEETILEPGGHIWLAVDADGEVIGTAALLYEGLYEGRPLYELGKMGVLESCRGRGIGKALCARAIDHARELGAGKIELLTNSSLPAALHVYRSLGFKDRPVTDKERALYKRVDVVMELCLDAEDGAR
jgi:putative acetyltransferase